MRNERLQHERDEQARVEEARRHQMEKETNAISFQQSIIRKERNHIHEMERLSMTLGSAQNHQFNMTLATHNQHAFSATMSVPHVTGPPIVPVPQLNPFVEARRQLAELNARNNASEEETQAMEE